MPILPQDAFRRVDGSLEHLCEGVVDGRADAVLAASIFHFGLHTIAEAKAYLRERGVEVRLEP